MNYAKHYDALTTRAAGRRLEGYFERHHVVPRCMGGSNAKTNIVRLTAEEHFVAHKLLVRMYPSHRGLLWAAVSMTNGSGKQAARQGNKLYGWLRRDFAAAMSEQAKVRTYSPETRAKMSAPRKNWKPHFSDEHRARLSAASRGKPKSANHRQQLSLAKRGKKRPPHSAEWRANQREGMLRHFEGRRLQTIQMRET
jgi:hypothetical protein